jgi:hypothetical protein
VAVVATETVVTAEAAVPVSVEVPAIAVVAVAINEALESVKAEPDADVARETVVEVSVLRPTPVGMEPDEEAPVDDCVVRSVLEAIAAEPLPVAGELAIGEVVEG